MANESIPPIRLFYCYSSTDKSLCEELDRHLAPLKRSGRIECWYDQMIIPGSEWEPEIEYRLNTAHIILLLVSPDFLDSYFCYEKEMKLALQRHMAGTAKVIPIILRHADWKDAPFSHLQTLPADAKPIANWPNHDEFFVTVATGIRRVIEEMFGKQALLKKDTHPAQQHRVENASSPWPDRTPSSGKYTIHANEVKAVVQGDNFGTVNNHGLDLSELLKLKELLRGDSTS